MGEYEKNNFNSVSKSVPIAIQPHTIYKDAYGEG